MAAKLTPAQRKRIRSLTALVNGLEVHAHRRKGDPPGLLCVVHTRGIRRRHKTPKLERGGHQVHQRATDEAWLFHYHERRKP